jgi:hypothetical protein
MELQGRIYYTYTSIPPLINILDRNNTRKMATNITFHEGQYRSSHRELTCHSAKRNILISLLLSTSADVLEGSVSHQERTQLLGQQGATIWLTGLSASGKVSSHFTIDESGIRRCVSSQANAHGKFVLCVCSRPLPLLWSNTCCSASCTLSGWMETTSGSG